MKIKVIPGSGEWTDFETKEWASADKKHYGKALDWKEKKFALIARDDDDSIMAVLRMKIEVRVCLI